MPLTYATKAATPPNLCLGCNEPIRRPKRFCSDDCKEDWLTHSRKFTPKEIAEAKASWTPAKDWKMKLAVSRPF
jgi:hypothetical protein